VSFVLKASRIGIFLTFATPLLNVFRFLKFSIMRAAPCGRRLEEAALDSEGAR
jgi:hypothetical protein